MHVLILHALVIEDEVVAEHNCCTACLLGLVVRCIRRVATLWAATQLHASNERCVQRLSL